MSTDTERITFPPIETVNGLRIIGWYLLDRESGEMVPAFYCGEHCAKESGGYAGRSYDAAPLYAINAEDKEYCDGCLESLN